jgi:hypothetical protein
MVRRALLVATVLCALSLRASADDAQGSADAGAPAAQALSNEDVNVAQQLAELEDIELVENLDLFDDKSADAPKSADAGTPDAGTPDAGTPDVGVPDAGAADGGSPP